MSYALNYHVPILISENSLPCVLTYSMVINSVILHGIWYGTHRWNWMAHDKHDAKYHMGNSMCQSWAISILFETWFAFMITYCGVK